MAGENKGLTALAFIAGLAIGINWPHIKKYIEPYLKTAGKEFAKLSTDTTKFLAEQKERMEDVAAEIAVKKKGARRAKA